MTRRSQVMTAVLLAVAAWILYSRTIPYGFVHFDDVRILRNHPELYGQASFLEGVRAVFLENFPREEPLVLRDLSWVADGRLFGFGNPVGYHLGNVLLHGVVVALLFVFLLGTTGRAGFALATAAAFLLLAVHVEPVAWIMGRKDVLSALFMLLALCFQTQRLRGRGRAAGWYGLTLVCVAGGLLSKISVLTFPIVLLLHAACFPFLRGERPPAGAFDWRRLARRELPLAAPALLASLWVYTWYGGVLDAMGIFDRGYTATGWRHLWNLAVINPLGWWLYLRQVFAPASLSVLYTWPALSTPFPAGQIAAALATLAGVAALGVWMLRRRKDLLFYFGSFFILMAPYMNVVYIGIWVADRYLYVASFCLLALAVSAAGEALARGRRGARAAVWAAAVLFAAINLRHNIGYQPVWRDGESLWRYHIALSAPSVSAYENLAGTYYAVALEAGSPEEMGPWIRRMEVVIEGGLDSFWPGRGGEPPRATWYLFFLRSIVQQVRGLPDEEALQSLLTSDRLHAGFDATNLNLARVYGKMARGAADPGARKEYAALALSRFDAYVRLAFRGRPPDAAVRAEWERLRAEFTAAADPHEVRPD